MFMGVYETRTLAPPPDTQEGRVEGKNVKCMEQNPLAGGGVVLGFIFLFFFCRWPLRAPTPL